jgi:hypothetical protein
MFKRFFILSVSLFFLVESCFAQGSPDAILKNLPASYVGTYEWEGDPDVWNVTVAFSERSAGNNGEVRLVGVEHFVNRQDKNKKFDSKVRAVINTRTLGFDMSEVDETRKDGFISMVYTGKISPELSNINATWTGSQGKKVILKLRASDR